MSNNRGLTKWSMKTCAVGFSAVRNGKLFGKIMTEKEVRKIMWSENTQISMNIVLWNIIYLYTLCVHVYEWQLKNIWIKCYLWVMGMLVVLIFLFGLSYIFQIIVYNQKKIYNLKMHTLESFVLIQPCENMGKRSLMGIRTECHQWLLIGWWDLVFVILNIFLMYFC